mmetsp:Transcript_99891/g.176001  ORF Transcript_99891/g.176001 Transcript_99891/m.176001 type:complete len:200 (-) Transcript_99891:65-664(-)
MRGTSFYRTESSCSTRNRRRFEPGPWRQPAGSVPPACIGDKLRAGRWAAGGHLQAITRGRACVRNSPPCSWLKFWALDPGLSTLRVLKSGRPPPRPSPAPLALKLMRRLTPKLAQRLRHQQRDAGAGRQWLNRRLPWLSGFACDWPCSAYSLLGLGWVCGGDGWPTVSSSGSDGAHIMNSRGLRVMHCGIDILSRSTGC